MTEQTSQEGARESLLSARITTEIFYALGLGRNRWPQKAFGGLFAAPAARFARLAASAEDGAVAGGLSGAGQAILPLLNITTTVSGVENIPANGPLIIACNHPGAYDSAVLAAVIPRPDLKLLASDVPFTRALVEISRNLIYVPPDASGRMAAVREAVRHLQAGGALLIFARGDVEPDPAVMAGAADTLSLWSSSLELLLRKVPQTSLQIAMASNIIQQRFLRNPLIRLRRQPYHRQKMAELFQMISQLLAPQKYRVQPQVSFAEAVPASQLPGGAMMPAIQALARRQLDWHSQHFHLPGRAQES